MEFSGLSDEQLLDVQRGLAGRLCRVEAELTAVAAEIAHRSRRELGYAGLAQRLGARTPERLISQVAGISHREAGALVRVGGMTGPVAEAVASGAIGVDAADAIRAIERPDLEAQLLTETAGLPPEKIARHARELRDALEPVGTHDRERELRRRRYLHLVPQPDGMTRVSGLLDRESVAIVVAAVDAATSPRRGVRFVDPDDAPRVDDERTVEQIAADALVELVRIGSAAGSEVLGATRPAVRIHVDRDAVTIEGQTARASAATAHRYACAAGICRSSSTRVKPSTWGIPSASSPRDSASPCQRGTGAADSRVRPPARLVRSASHHAVVARRADECGRWRPALSAPPSPPPRQRMGGCTRRQPLRTDSAARDRSRSTTSSDASSSDDPARRLKVGRSGRAEEGAPVPGPSGAARSVGSAPGPFDPLR